MTAVELRLDELVAVTRPAPGSHCVVLRGPGLPNVKLCHFPNPARAAETAEAVRRYLSALLGESRPADSPRVPDPKATGSVA